MIFAAASRAENYYNVGSRPLLALRVGQAVYVRLAPRSWEPGQIVEAHPTLHSYVVRMTSGATLRRNRRYLRPDRATLPPLQPHQKQPLHQRNEDEEREKALVIVSSSTVPAPPAQTSPEQREAEEGLEDDENLVFSTPPTTTQGQHEPTVRRSERVSKHPVRFIEQM